MSTEGSRLVEKPPAGPQVCKRSHQRLCLRPTDVTQIDGAATRSMIRSQSICSPKRGDPNDRSKSLAALVC